MNMMTLSKTEVVCELQVLSLPGWLVLGVNIRSCMQPCTCDMTNTLCDCGLFIWKAERNTRDESRTYTPKDMAAAAMGGVSHKTPADAA